MINRQHASNISHGVREERFNLGEGGHRFDATLDRSQRLLTLKMKVKFDYINLPRSWPTTDAQTQWQNNFINTVQSRWSFRYFLAPDRPRRDTLLRQIIACIQVIPVTASQHFTIKNVGYATSFQKSFVSGRSATLDALDTARRSDIPQIPAEHEFGHMLGLPHVHCNSNNPSCYGVTSVEKSNIMGKGSNVSPRDYKAFAAAMYYFTGYNWHATSR